MERKPHVVVVGGGVAGSAVAIELGTRGARVTLVDKDQPGSGATGASAGMLAPQYEAHGPDAAFRFAVKCREVYASFVSRLETLASWKMGYREDGMLVANRTPEEERGARKDLEFQHELGLRGEIISTEEARKIHGGVSQGVESWLWLPGEGQVDAQRLAVALADATSGAGVELVRGAEVTAVDIDGGSVSGVRLSGDREIQADAVVLAAGAWARQVQGLPRELPVWPIRGQMLRLVPTEPPAWPLVCSHDGRYLVPRENGSILVGSTMEDVGFDDRVTEEGRETLAELAATLIPSLADSTIVEAWAGFRPMSADQMPILGPDPEMDGLFYAAGHGRNGILYAPLAGTSVAELVLEGHSDLPWQEFSVQRFLDQGEGKLRNGGSPARGVG